MSRRFFQFAMWVPWLALPLIAVRFWLVWDQLPVRMATHFNAAGQANGWMTREVALGFGLGLTAFILVVFTVVLAVLYRKHAPDAASWALLGMMYFIVGMIYYGNESILNYNLHGQAVEVKWMIILTPLAILALTAVFLGSNRGQALPSQGWIAEEVHASPLFGTIFLLPLIIEFAVLVTVPVPGVRLGLSLMCLLFLVIAAQAWSGFHYFIGQSGVEVRTLGFRLRSIPLQQIRKYAVESWSPWRGYGIRGVGGTRAYVWGNKVVHITTANGDVYLGHAQPERVVRELDRVTAFNQEGHQGTRGTV